MIFCIPKVGDVFNIPEFNNIIYLTKIRATNSYYFTTIMNGTYFIPKINLVEFLAGNILTDKKKVKK